MEGGEIEVACREFYDKILALKREERDDVWLSVVKSYLTPIIYEGYFDYVIGNPPWIAYRYIADPEYQERIVKPLTKDEYKLTTDPELITHMEIATLFFARSIDKFLRDGGRIGFVMPRAVFSADQHDRLRRARVEKIKFRFDLVIDCENVEPLFYVPTCILIATKGVQQPAPVEIEALIVRGRLPENKHKIMPLAEALKHLKIESGKIYLVEISERSFWSYQRSPEIKKGRSYYYELFRQGATIVPRPFYFVDIIDSSHPQIVVVKTSRRIGRREAKVRESIGPLPVERKYIYGVLTSSEVIPFYHLPPVVAVLPLKPLVSRYQLLEKEDIARLGHVHMARWLEEAERLWEKHRGSKAKRITLYEWLDYQNKLTHQNPNASFKVVYLASGTHIASCVVRRRQFEISSVKIDNTVIDYELYVYHTDNEDEAYYLTSILNSTVLDELIKPMQSKGAYGERHIVKKPLELPIPKFDSRNSVHVRLAELGRECESIVAENIERLLRDLGYDRALREKGYLNTNQVGVLRSRVRELLKDKLREIDELVLELLTDSPARASENLLKYAKR